MEFYTFFVFFSVIVTPDGEIKSFSKHVQECPTWEIVQELHEPKIEAGEIIDWGATCLETKLPLKAPPSEDAVPTTPPVPIEKSNNKGIST
tara:strand:+ start:163 stop:435 length:273 start_codon:yes stop_codon:yes gene_type:complete